MGYTHDTQMAQYIPASAIQKSAGTWTPTLAANTVADVRTAADANFNLFIPIKVPSNAAILKGARLKSIDVYYSIGTAAMDDIATVELERMSLNPNASAVTGAVVPITIDTNNDTTAKRRTMAAHKMTVTLNTPAWVDDNDAYVLYILCDAAATSIFNLFGAVANFDFRV